VEKAMALGARVVTVSDSSGTVYDEAGFTPEKLALLMEVKNHLYGRVDDYAKRVGATFLPGQRPWSIPVDVALPCATQNELDGEDAKTLVHNGVLCVAEGANMPATLEAVEVFEKSGVWYAPGKASNAGGVATSGLEMSQNAMRLSWSREEVDQRLHEHGPFVRFRRCCEESERKVDGWKQFHSCHRCEKSETFGHPPHPPTHFASMARMKLFPSVNFPFAFFTASSKSDEWPMFMQALIDLLARPGETHGVLAHLQARGGDAAGVAGLARRIPDAALFKHLDGLEGGRHVGPFGHAENAVVHQRLGIFPVQLVLGGTGQGHVDRDGPGALPRQEGGADPLGIVIDPAIEMVFDFHQEGQFFRREAGLVVDGTAGVGHRDHAGA
jgi:hypothetical protein